MAAFDSWNERLTEAQKAMCRFDLLMRAKENEQSVEVACRSGNVEALRQFVGKPGVSSLQCAIFAILGNQHAILPVIFEMFGPIKRNDDERMPHFGLLFHFIVEEDDCKSVQYLYRMGLRFHDSYSSMFSTARSSRMCYAIHALQPIGYKALITGERRHYMLAAFYHERKFEVLEFFERELGVIIPRGDHLVLYWDWKFIMTRSRHRAANKIQLLVLQWLGQKPEFRERQALRSWQSHYGEAESILPM